MADPERILIIRPSALGDVCRSVPVLVSLRKSYPRAQIDWLVRDVYADAVRAHPALSGVVLFARSQLGESAGRFDLRPTTSFLNRLKRERYQLVVDVQGLARSGLFAWATRAPRRIGFADARELGWLGLTERVRVAQGLHAVDRELALLHGAGIDAVADARLHAPLEDRAAVDSDPGLRGPYAVIAPTSAWAGKRWPIERFAALAQHLVSAHGTRVVVVGTECERGQCGPVLELAAREARVVDRIGKTGVGRLMAIIERAVLVVANDSSALHMAVGFSRPLIALFGPTRVERVGPYGRSADVIQHVEPGDVLDHKSVQAGRELMERITTEEVVRAADKRLGGAAEAG